MPDTTELHNHTNLPDELYMALGRLTARYSLFEYQLALTIKRFWPGADWGEIWDWIGKFRRDKLQREAIKVLELCHVEQKTLEDFERIIEEAGGLATKRHDAVHGAWSVDKNGQLGVTCKGKSLNITADDLNELAEKFHRLAARVAKLASPDFVKQGEAGLVVESSSAAFHGRWP